MKHNNDTYYMYNYAESIALNLRNKIEALQTLSVDESPKDALVKCRHQFSNAMNELLELNDKLPKEDT